MAIKLTGATEKQTLQHQLAIERERSKAKDESIESLTEEREFLREELETRRGELEQLSEFFRSVGEAAGSAAQLQEGSQRKVQNESEKGTDERKQPDPIDATARRPVDAISPSFWEKHTPTFRKGLKRVGGSLARV